MQVLQNTCPHVVVTSFRPEDSNWKAVSMQIGHLREDFGGGVGGDGSGGLHSNFFDLALGARLEECLPWIESLRSDGEATVIHHESTCTKETHVVAYVHLQSHNWHCHSHRPPI